MFLERFGRATKLRSHKKKKVFQMNRAIITDIYLYLAYSMVGLLIVFFSRRTPLPKKIEGKI